MSIEQAWFLDQFCFSISSGFSNGTGVPDLLSQVAGEVRSATIA